MFALTSSVIDSTAAAARLAAPAAGALVVFEGRVRDHHLGRAVTRLEYEAFDELAGAEGDAIVAETERLFPGATVHCIHRTGRLEIGEAAVWIGVASPHRQAGFAACRHVIEEIKRRLPIWKKEHHPDGAAEWVNCTVEAAPPAHAHDYHARQIALPEVGESGQAKIAAARVLLVGVGGLGCPAALYLAGAGVGRLTLVDGGRVERSNLHRQILFTAAEIGAPKSLAAAARLREHNPGVGIVAHDGDLTPRNARALIAGQSVVLDCSDNFPTRFLVHDACHALGVPLVQAAVHRFEGTLDVFVRGNGGCLHCLSPGHGAAGLEAAGQCAGGPVFAPAVGTLGVMQAGEALKLLLGLTGEAPRQTRLLNLLDGSLLAIERAPRADCPMCGALAPLPPLPHGPPAADDPSLWITARALAETTPPPRTVYLTEAGEMLPPQPDQSLLAVPAHDLARLRELADEGPIALTCRHGLRSAALARLLRAEGLAHVHALHRSD